MQKLTLCLALFIMTSSLSGQSWTDNSLGNLKKMKRTDNGISIETNFGKAQVMVYNAETIRIRITKNEPEPDFSYAVISQPVTTPFKILESEGLILLSTDSLRLQITTNPVRFKFLTPANQVINEDDPAFGTNWVGEEVTIYKKLQEGEKFIGLGEKTGNLDRRGEAYTNWNSDVPGYLANADPIYATFPFYIGIHHKLVYGIFFDNTYKSYFNFGASNDRFSSFGADAGEMNYYFFGGKTISRILENYTLLTGRIPMPPFWGLGYQQSRWSYFPDKDVLKLASTFREKKIPLDVIYLDIHYMDAYKVFTWHPQRFGAPKAMIGKLKDMGVHTAVIIDPGIKVEKGYKAYEEGVAQNMFLKYPDGTNFTAQVWPGWCNFPDFTKPEARKWWGEKFKDNVDCGVEGFWNDMNEIASWGGGKNPSIVRFYWEGKGAAYRQGKNVYGQLMSRSTYEGSRSLMGKRPLILTRAAYSGAQRYTAIWTGDNVASDEHMLLGCRLINSLGLAGMAFSGVDVGGFIGDAPPKLFARWLTIGTFTPFFRVHKHYDYLSSEPWSYGADVENISMNYISLRYKLLPYIYSAFYEAHKTGNPVSRTLVIDNTYDEKCWYYAYQNQYMFGPSLLVAPIESTKEITKVYLPEGNWYDFFTGQPYQGNQEITVDCQTDKLPVFAKGGSIVPMQKAIQSTSENPGDTLFVHVYFGNNPSEYMYYEDDGLSYEYENGKFLERKMSFLPDSKQFLIAPDANKDAYPGKFKNIVLILHGFEPVAKGLKIGNKPIIPADSVIDMLNVYKPTDSQWLNNRSYPQHVYVIHVGDFPKGMELSW